LGGDRIEAGGKRRNASCADRDGIRKAAVDCASEEYARRARRRFACPARVALAAGPATLRDNLLPGFDVGNTLADREHAPDVFVAEHERQARGVEPLIDGHISAADTGRFDGNDDPAGAGLRYGPLFESEV
jgi:hypothetical protein